MVSKIALEEHFLCPGFETYWAATVSGVAPDALQRITARLSDFGDSRLEAMDKAGIAKSVLSLAGPGVQVEPDRATAVRMAAGANDYLAKELQKGRDRYAGFGHLAMQDANAAADELERCMRDLGFSGAMINGHTNGQYLDHPSLAPFWERAAALRAPIYVHQTCQASDCKIGWRWDLTSEPLSQERIVSAGTAVGLARALQPRTLERGFCGAFGKPLVTP